MKRPPAANYLGNHSLKPESNTGSDRLYAFCQLVASRYSNNWPPPEEQIAEEFASFFDVGFSTLGAWIELCTSLNIRVTLTSLPQGLGGHHTCFNNERAIWLPEKDRFPGAREHTLLHELREILEHIFCDLGLPTVDAESHEARAEEFAAHTRMIASKKMWGAFLEDAKKIDSTWWRRGAYVLIGFGALLHAAGSAFLPYFEDSLPPSD